MFFVGQLTGLVRNLNIQIYPDTVNVIYVKLCMMVLLIELYLLTIFQGHSNVEHFKLKILLT